jgi:hypothetical protein
MVKRTKRYNKRSQKGGLFGFFEGEKKTDGTGPTQTTTETGYFSNIKMPEISNPFSSSTDSSTNSGTTDTGYFSNIKMPEISNPFSSSSEPTTPVSNTYDQNTSVSNTYDPNTSVPTTPVSNTSSYPGAGAGGRRRTMRGGRGLGLTYYATPVNGIKVVEPTYMEYYKGGRRRRSRKGKKGKKCNKTCRKKHRHCRK